MFSPFSLPCWFSAVAFKSQFLTSDGKVSVVDDLGSDVNPAFNLKVDEIGLSVPNLVESWLLWGGTLDISKCVVVINHRDEKWLASSTFVQLIVELQLLLVIRLEL